MGTMYKADPVDFYVKEDGSIDAEVNTILYALRNKCCRLLKRENGTLNIEPVTNCALSIENGEIVGASISTANGKYSCGGAGGDRQLFDIVLGHTLNMPEISSGESYTTGGTSDFTLHGNVFEGDKCIVTFDGVEYECIAKSMDMGYTLGIGNAALGWGGEDTGEPFCVHTNMYNPQGLYINTREGGEHVISIQKVKSNNHNPVTAIITMKEDGHTECTHTHFELMEAYGNNNRLNVIVKMEVEGVTISAKATTMYIIPDNLGIVLGAWMPMGYIEINVLANGMINVMD